MVDTAFDTFFGEASIVPYREWGMQALSRPLVSPKSGLTPTCTGPYPAPQCGAFGPWREDEMGFLQARRGLISIWELERGDMDAILDGAAELRRTPRPQGMHGAVMASLFFEPSTRTRLSFETAQNRLGGGVVGFASAGSSSVSKGESLADTIRTVAGYADVIVMRHPLEGAARWASEVTQVPVINAGDGANQHPTQTLLDLFTIRENRGRLDGLTVGFLGDLRYGRTVHSLVEALKLYGARFRFIAPAALQIPQRYLDELAAAGLEYELVNQPGGAVEGLDVLYVTRIQKERLGDEVEYERFKGCYRVDEALLRENPEMAVMHPLPRVDELDPAVDGRKQCIYFEQAANGIPVRQVLLLASTGRW